MIIQAVQLIPELNVERYAWSHLRRFHNVSSAASLITELQQVPAREKDNVKKQAEQLRYCLQQAEEYCDAARAVSLATKPTLLYYSVMSLALAEILLKQSADSSLDKARDQHRHHGLTSTIQPTKGGVIALERVAGQMKAAPVIRGTDRLGTFELWHRSAREHPVAGLLHEPPLTSFRNLLGVHDDRMTLLPQGGLTLLDCFRSLPDLANTISLHGLEPYIVRGRVVLIIRGDLVELQVHFHPGSKSAWEACCERIAVRPGDMECMEVDYKENYGHIIFRYVRGSGVDARFPPAATMGTEDVRFCTKDFGLNEFGLIYVALFILGNYARYYPDKWIKDVERATPIAHVAQQFLELATERAPLLSLSELSRCLLVPGHMR
jgi:hypothetical protein